MPTLTTPTSADIAAEIARLKEMKPRIPQFTAFQDDNWAGLDAQVTVLQENLTLTQIEKRFGDADEEADLPETLLRAEEARAWLDGEGDAPSVDWESLLDVVPTELPE
jgi:hypothetical protein